MKKYNPDDEVKWWLVVSFLFIFVILYLYLLGWLPKAYGMEVEPQIRMGGIHLRENGLKEGNKYIVGITPKFSGGDAIKWSLTPEFWKMGEALDEDTEIPNVGYGLMGELGKEFKFKSVSLTPFLGLYAGQWKREEGKYQGAWTYVNYLDATCGFNFKWSFIYGKAGILLPLYYKSDYQTFKRLDTPAELLELGVSYKGVSLGVYRRKLAFDGLNSSSIYLNGFVLGYSF